MKPGDLVRNEDIVFFYDTVHAVNKQIPTGEVPAGSVGIILSNPDGTWVKWNVNGKVVWSNWNLMEVISETR